MNMSEYSLVHTYVSVHGFVHVCVDAHISACRCILWRV